MGDTILVGSMYLMASALALVILRRNHGKKHGLKKWLYFTEALMLVLIGKGIVGMLFMTFNRQKVDPVYLFVAALLVLIVNTSFRRIHKSL